MLNRQWLIDGNPAGRAVTTSDFKRVENELSVLPNGRIRVRNEYLEFSPSLKGQMENKLDYAKPTTFGGVMRARGIGEVIESKAPNIKVGQKVKAYLGWQDYADLPPDEAEILPDDKFLRAHLGPLGSSGMTAYFGLLRAGRPITGDTVLISGAAGAVGSIAGQIARHKGCRVVGTAGGAEKCDWLINEAGLDGAIDYKSQDLRAAISESCPDGANVIFDNVGGAFLDSALELENLAIGARIVLCGAISRYEKSPLPPGPTNYFNLILRRATMQGILSPDYKADYPIAIAQIKSWMEAGTFVYREDIQEEFENIPETFLRLFSGKNLGKQLIKLS